MNKRISAEDLYTQDTALEIMQCDRPTLNKLVRQGDIDRIKCIKDKRFSFYLKSQIDDYKNKQQEFEFYYEKEARNV